MMRRPTIGEIRVGGWEEGPTGARGGIGWVERDPPGHMQRRHLTVVISDPTTLHPYPHLTLVRPYAIPTEVWRRLVEYIDGRVTMVPHEDGG